MKSFAILLSAGLVSAVNLASPIVQSGTIDPNSLANNLNNSANGASALNLGDLNNIQGGNVNGLDLNSLNINGLNLGSVDLGNQNDVVNAILEMMLGLCLNNNIFNEEELLELGEQQDEELFLELAQLMQLEELGFVSLGGIQSLFNSGLVLGNFNLGKSLSAQRTHVSHNRGHTY
jgi:hypothetical protein